MINQFQKRGHNGSLIKQKIDKDNLQEREQLLKKKKERKTLPHQLSLSLKYNRTLPKKKKLL